MGLRTWWAKEVDGFKTGLRGEPVSDPAVPSPQGVRKSATAGFEAAVLTKPEGGERLLVALVGLS
jgi:hypothetical protein